MSKLIAIAGDSKREWFEAEPAVDVEVEEDQFVIRLRRWDDELVEVVKRADAVQVVEDDGQHFEFRGRIDEHVSERGELLLSFRGEFSSWKA